MTTTKSKVYLFYFKKISQTFFEILSYFAFLPPPPTELVSQIFFLTPPGHTLLFIEKGRRKNFPSAHLFSERTIFFEY